MNPGEAAPSIVKGLVSVARVAIHMLPLAWYRVVAGLGFALFVVLLILLYVGTAPTGYNWLLGLALLVLVFPFGVRVAIRVGCYFEKTRGTPEAVIRDFVNGPVLAAIPFITSDDRKHYLVLSSQQNRGAWVEYSVLVLTKARQTFGSLVLDKGVNQPGFLNRDDPSGPPTWGSLLGVFRATGELIAYHISISGGSGSMTAFVNYISLDGERRYSARSHVAFDLARPRTTIEVDEPVEPRIIEHAASALSRIAFLIEDDSRLRQACREWRQRYGLDVSFAEIDLAWQDATLENRGSTTIAGVTDDGISIVCVFKGPVLAVRPDGRWAVVYHPSTQYGWARSATVKGNVAYFTTMDAEFEFDSSTSQLRKMADIPPERSLEALPA